MDSVHGVRSEPLSLGEEILRNLDSFVKRLKEWPSKINYRVNEFRNSEIAN